MDQKTKSRLIREQMDLIEQLKKKQIGKMKPEKRIGLGRLEEDAMNEWKRLAKITPIDEKKKKKKLPTTPAQAGTSEGGAAKPKKKITRREI